MYFASKLQCGGWHKIEERTQQNIKLTLTIAKSWRSRPRPGPMTNACSLGNQLAISATAPDTSLQITTLIQSLVCCLHSFTVEDLGTSIPVQRLQPKYWISIPM